MTAMSAPPLARLKITPVKATRLTRSQRPAPTFCAAMEDTAAPMASAGICT
jgi:hypothetical protein